MIRRVIQCTLFLFVRVYSTNCLNELSDISVSSSTNSSLYFNLTRLESETFSAIRPDFVCLPNTREEVQRCIKCAYDNGLKVRVKNGGHSFAGYSTLPDGFMISLENMCTVGMVENEDVLIGSGCRWRDVYSVIHADSWIVTGGLCPSVGVAGFTSGGGTGPIARMYGLAADNVVSMDVVLQDGSFVTASETLLPDLFWALRGSGGGNFGVITSIQFKVHKGPSRLTWSHLCYSNSLTKEVLQKAAMFEQTQPRTVNLDITVDSEICLWIISQHDKETTKDIIHSLTFVSDHRPTTQLIREFSCFWKLIQDYASVHHYKQYTTGKDQLKAFLVKELSDDLIEILSEPLQDFQSLSFIQFGGTIAGVLHSSTAFPHRDAKYLVYMSVGYDASTEKQALQKLRSFGSSMKEYTIGGYINFLESTMEMEFPMEFYYGDNLPRLLDIKRKYVPLNDPMRFPMSISYPKHKVIK